MDPERLEQASQVVAGRPSFVAGIQQAPVRELIDQPSDRLFVVEDLLDI
jgi:hypothetical protein